MAELDEVARIITEAEQAASVGDHAAAERALRRARRLQETHLGLVHPDVANTLNDLGVVCDILGRPDEAEFLYRRALGIARKTLAADHPYIATNLQNLSNLYRAQGKPEKLAKVADGRSSRHGHAEIDSADESGWEADAAPDRMPRPETPAVSAPVTRAQSGAPSQIRSHRLYERSAQPAVLLVGAGVVLLSILGLLFGGGDGPDASGQGEDTGASLQAPARGRDSVGPDPAAGSVSAEAEPVPNAGYATGTTDSGGAGLTAPASLSTTVADEAGALSPEPVTGRPDSRAALAVATSSVVEAKVCSQLVTHGTDGTPLAE